MDFEPTSEQRLVRDTARAFTDTTYGLLVEEIGRGDSAMRTGISVQT